MHSRSAHTVNSNIINEVVKWTDASTQSHIEVTVDICSGKHTLNGNIIEGITVQSEEVPPNVHIKATVEHSSGKQTINSNITESMTHESEEALSNVHVEVGTGIIDGSDDEETWAEKQRKK